MCNSISTSDWIQIIIAIITLFSVISSIIIAIKTLKQNSQMIEDSTRPCIIIYKETININNPNEYIAIKNFGQSAGIINDLRFDTDKFSKIDNGLEQNYDFLKNITLAPNQKYLLPIKTANSNIKIMTFDIKYESSTHLYTDTFNVNLSQDYSIAFNHQNKGTSSGNELKELITISNSLQELIKRL